MMKMVVVVLLLMFYPVFRLSSCSLPVDQAGRWTWQGDDDDDDDDESNGDGGGGDDVSHHVSFVPVLSTSGSSRIMNKAW